MHVLYREGAHDFLRSVGLELAASVITSFRKFFNNEEPKKPVITHSIGTAAARCGVHLLPICVSIVIIALNLQHVFLGRTLPGVLDQTTNLALLQIAAKMQEMLIDASLAALVVEIIRDDMLYGDGVPLGWIGGGFLFSSLSYFWSVDFWCSFQCRTRPWRKRRLYGILMLAGSIAAFAGPACAVLLIPRLQEWPAGGSEFYLHNSTEELWPAKLSFNPNGPEGFCAFENATYIPGCPSGGYWTLRDWMQGHLYSENAKSVPKMLDRYNCRARHTFRGSHVLVPDIVMTGIDRNRACETSYHTIHLATAVTQEQIARDWAYAVENIRYIAPRLTTGELKYWTSMKISSSSRVPVVRVACSEAQSIAASDTNLFFPVLPEYECWGSLDDVDVFDGDATPRNSSRTSWTSLPRRFGSVSTGLIVELPWAEDEASRIAIGCSVDARWADGIVSQSQIFNDGYTSFGGTDFVGGALSTHVDAPCSASRNWSAFTSTPNKPWSRIQLDSSWLKILAPVAPEVAPGLNPHNLTTLESLISQSILSSAQLASVSVRTSQNLVSGYDFRFNVTTYLETVVATFIADGLSRHGSAHLFDTSNAFANWTLKDYRPVPGNSSQLIRGGQALQKPAAETPYTTLTAKVTIIGFCFKAAQLSDYLSIALLLTHILLGLSHTAWLLRTRNSSSCWDSITELIALAQNSRPAPIALKNTCAGIKRAKTFSKVARVRATGTTSRETEHATAGHLEILFDEDEDVTSYTHLEGSTSSLNVQATELVPNCHIDIARDPDPLAHFPTILSDKIRKNVTSRVRGRSSTVSTADTETHLLRPERLCEGDFQMTQLETHRSFSERVQVGEEYGHSSEIFLMCLDLIHRPLPRWRRQSWTPPSNNSKDERASLSLVHCYEPLTRIGIKVVFLGKGRYLSEVWVRARRNVLSVSRIELWAEYKYEVDYEG